MSKSSEWKRAVYEAAARWGCTVELTGSTHFRVKHPSGWFVIFASSPTSVHVDNIERWMKKASRREPRHGQHP